MTRTDVLKDCEWKREDKDCGDFKESVISHSPTVIRASRASRSQKRQSGNS